MNASDPEHRSPDDSSRARLDACRAELGELREAHRRLAADYANQRRRQRAEVDDSVSKERSALLRELLDVVDDLERALAASAGAPPSALRDGLEAVLHEARRRLAQRGVERMDSVGAAFDPERHDAVGLSEDGDGDRVHAELRAGYLLDGEVLRPAEVLVGRGASR